ncbi:Cu(I)-responsive transcriptional regulator (plasmid) [Phaeobacter inhibens]|uniref:Cu(I)-responsive transcriptional regulator n=1 Tax=Phaeobacter inhibens TaxID=221822 RepID=A0ABM6RJY0_9RHOB|nr:Cu(I)-responsive transcriptional regulator [Phaeobacter inhibens]AUQ96839.1 Cu(I)-responsive transcriptional regulator [Phaeobacter inhibens]AUR22040.1 Cu(I)-responsive transcriptional regulator [Phaeobacter inhibens]
MNIGDVSRQSGVPPKTIRYYEEIGLIRPNRSENGYRAFTENHVHKLAFLGRARALGFTIEDCRTLLALYEDENRESVQVKTVAEDHLRQIEEKRETAIHENDAYRACGEMCRGSSSGLPDPRRSLTCTNVRIIDAGSARFRTKLRGPASRYP